VRKFAEACLPEHAAVPVRFWLIDPMPLTAVGKVLKRALRTDAADLNAVASQVKAKLDPLALRHTTL
jgi:non-ribosomal peptide synthetase component E (peptide arylation enzyme)